MFSRRVACGSAALSCGKALPFRRGPSNLTLGVEAAPQPARLSLAKILVMSRPRSGKAKPFRKTGRQSRIRQATTDLAFASVLTKTPRVITGLFQRNTSPALLTIYPPCLSLHQSQGPGWIETMKRFVRGGFLCFAGPGINFDNTKRRYTTYGMDQNHSHG
jgi:hypothetical protein